MKQPFTPRADSNRKFVGGYRPKIEAWDKASGKVKYVDDITLASNFQTCCMPKFYAVHMPNARIKNIDVSKAEKLPGVVCVMTYKDPEFTSLKPTNAGWTDGVDTVSYDGKMWSKFNDRRVLGDYACWVTDEVGAVVAAKTEEIAEEALRLIEVDWEVFPFVLDPIKAMEPGAPVIHPDMTENNILPPENMGATMYS